MDAFVQSTLQNCFSIVVAAFLLLRMERELRVLREAIDRLRYCQVCRFAPIISAEIFDADVLDAKFAGPRSNQGEADAS